MWSLHGTVVASKVAGKHRPSIYDECYTHIQVMSDSLETGLDLRQFFPWRSILCPRCRRWTDGGLECETPETHALFFCPNREDAGHPANVSADVDSPVSDAVVSSRNGGRPKIRVGPQYQVVVPSSPQGFTIQNRDDIVTLDGIVVPMPLTEMEIKTQIQREKEIATRHQEQRRLDSPSPERKPAKKRPRSGAGAAATAVPVPVPMPVTTKKGRTVNPVKHFKP